MARIPLSQIQNEANDLQWKLLSTEYKNLETELKWRCPAQHEIVASYKQWRKNHNCPICELRQRDASVPISIKAKGNKEYRILALDQATYETGWAIFSNGELVQSGVYKTTTRDEAERINEVRNWIWSIVVAWQIDYVQMEDIQLQDHSGGQGNNELGVTTYRTLARLQGVLQDLFYTNNVSYSFAPPATWRKYNGIKGRSRVDKKKNAQIKVELYYGLEATLDEAEAICIGRYAVSNHNKNNVLLSWG